jgi:hypothetical protein
VARAALTPPFVAALIAGNAVAGGTSPSKGGVALAFNAVDHVLIRAEPHALREP